MMLSGLLKRLFPARDAEPLSHVCLLRTDFALFLERLPGIERLAFTDGTPFADDTMLEWIAHHAAVRDLEAGDGVAPCRALTLS
jgi:hypothetical protein